MCFGGSKPAPEQPAPKWWINNPPQLEEAKVQLNEDATNEAKKKRQRTGTRTLQIPIQIPISPKNASSGLGIPKSR